MKIQVEEFGQELNETAYQIYSNPDLIETIALKKEFLSDSRTYDTVRDIEQFFLGVYYQSRVKDIVGMYLIRDDGELLGNFFPNYHPQMGSEYYNSLLEEAERNQYQPEMLIRYEKIYKEPFIQFLYPVRYLGKPSGLLIIDLKESTFRSLVERYNMFYHGEIALINAGGTAVYHTNPEMVGLQFSSDDANSRTVNLETSLFARGWKLNYRYEIDPNQFLYRIIAILMIILVGVLAIYISLRLSYHLTKPIVHLHQKMSRIQIGDYNARVEVKTRDEIGFLGNQFNRMVDTIQQLIEHDLKHKLMNQDTQIKALQAQISPHFLFNTLQMMAGIAEVNKVPDMKLICQSLSNMYRADA